MKGVQSAMRTTIIAIAAFLVLIIGTLQPAWADAGYLSVNEMEDLVAPLALYPDDLLGTVLEASEHPEQISEASQWLKANPQMSAEELNEASRALTWDKSVKALLLTPSTLNMLADDPQRTIALGTAYSMQRGSLCRGIQNMRRKAQLSGALHNSDSIHVSNSQGFISINPSSKNTLLVPTYTPAKVYTTAAPANSSVSTPTVSWEKVDYNAPSGSASQTKEEDDDNGSSLGSYFLGNSQNIYGGWGYPPYYYYDYGNYYNPTPMMNRGPATTNMNSVNGLATPAQFNATRANIMPGSANPNTSAYCGNPNCQCSICYCIMNYGRCSCTKPKNDSDTSSTSYKRDRNTNSTSYKGNSVSRSSAVQNHASNARTTSTGSRGPVQTTRSNTMAHPAANSPSITRPQANSRSNAANRPSSSIGNVVPRSSSPSRSSNTGRSQVRSSSPRSSSHVRSSSSRGSYGKSKR